MWMWMHGWRSELQTCQTSPSTRWQWLRNHRLHHLSRGKRTGETSDQTKTTIPNNNNQTQTSKSKYSSTANPIYDTRVKASDLRSRLMQHRPRRWTGSQHHRYYSRLQKTTADNNFSTADNRNLRNNLNDYEMTITMVWI